MVSQLLKDAGLRSSRLPRRLRLGTVNRALIGSVSDYVLHHPQCHVIVCRHKDHAHKDKSGTTPTPSVDVDVSAHDN
ncbi:hypothetical protein RRG08_027435 [Elysia crispata]|uniref:UspA domain-containing protein n=1 Tax=Elysia crispata TaxID=231223 RepID=A0AAE0YF45_9GAST|nr:hypothetical protein RRG08_027435 [Elysia crispata]